MAKKDPQLKKIYGSIYIMASHNAVIPSGADLFFLFFEMPGRKDARTPEKPLSATSNSLF